jgi:transcriptional regulator with XRE-family HTH domain
VPNTAERNPLFGIKARKMRGDTTTARAWLDTIGQTPGAMDLVPGQRLFFWIGQAAKARREDAGIRLEGTAAEIGVGKETVDRFEKGRTRPHELEAMLVGYAKLTGLEDPRDIVAQAVRLWYEAGVNPALSPAAGPGEGPLLSETSDEQPSPKAATRKAGPGRSARRQ